MSAVISGKFKAETEDIASVTAIAPAKINLSLYITACRADGYHEVHTVMQAVDVFEKVTVSKTGDVGNSIRIECQGFLAAQIPLDKTNIVFKATHSFFDFIKRDLPCGLLIQIEKKVPAGAGLAGGSADAAATIVALNELFSTKLTISEMMEVAGAVGADVPFCIQGGTKLGKGIGASLSPLSPLSDCYIVLVKPDFVVSTKAAYEGIDRAKDMLPPVSRKVESALDQGSLLKVAKHFENHFERALESDFYDKIKVLCNLINECGAMGACMTGSGSTVYGFFENKNDVEKCLIEIEKLEFCSWSCVARPFDGGAKIV